MFWAFCCLMCSHLLTTVLVSITCLRLFPFVWCDSNNFVEIRTFLYYYQILFFFKIMFLFQTTIKPLLLPLWTPYDRRTHSLLNCSDVLWWLHLTAKEILRPRYRVLNNLLFVSFYKLIFLNVCILVLFFFFIEEDCWTNCFT